jgi:hypothetical protein
VRRFIATVPRRRREVAVIEEALDVVLAEADVPADLLDGDAPLGDDSSHEALGHTESGGDLGDVQQSDGFLGVVGTHDHCKP